ncbi:MAG TPA: hypothetical protein VMW25_05120 [Clostridia bacterium]|nr:hypothetical protein [Clostridia bacterium]
MKISKTLSFFGFLIICLFFFSVVPVKATNWLCPSIDAYISCFRDHICGMCINLDETSGCFAENDCECISSTACGSYPGDVCNGASGGWLYRYGGKCYKGKPDADGNCIGQYYWKYNECLASDRCEDSSVGNVEWQCSLPDKGGGGTGSNTNGRILPGICSAGTCSEGCRNGGWYKTCCRIAGGVVTAGARLSGAVAPCSGGFCPDAGSTCVRDTGCDSTKCLSSDYYGCWILGDCAAPTNTPTPGLGATNTPTPVPTQGPTPLPTYCNRNGCTAMECCDSWVEIDVPSQAQVGSNVTLRVFQHPGWCGQSGQDNECGCAYNNIDFYMVGVSALGYQKWLRADGFTNPYKIWKLDKVYTSNSVGHWWYNKKVREQRTTWNTTGLAPGYYDVTAGGGMIYLGHGDRCSENHACCDEWRTYLGGAYTSGPYMQQILNRSVNHRILLTAPPPSCSGLTVSNSCPVPGESVILNQTTSNVDFLHRAYRWGGVGSFIHFGSNNTGAEAFTVPTGEGNLQLVVNACNRDTWQVCRWTGGVYNDTNMDCNPDTLTSSTCPGCNTTIGVCQKPGNPLFSEACESTGEEITLSWLDPAPPGSPNNETGFRITRDGSPLGNSPADTTSATFACPDFNSHTYGIVAYRDCGALVGGSCTGVEKVSTQNTITCSCAYKHWWQAKDGDVHAQGNIHVDVPKDNFLILEGDNDGQPGVASFKDDLNTSPGSLSKSDWDWQANTSYGARIGFEYLKNRLNIDTRESKTSFSDISGSGIYYFNDSKAIDFETLPVGTDKIIVFVDNDVNVGGDITVDQGGFFALIASGDIIIASEVIQAHGFFLADGEIRVPSGETEQVFEAQGSFIGHGGVSLERDLGPEANVEPAEFFVSRFDLYLNAPAEFRFSPFVFREVAP